MWMACIIFTPIAIVLTRAAAKDSIIFSKDSWSKYIKQKFRRDERSDS
jgi:hypothetical protein